MQKIIIISIVVVIFSLALALIIEHLEWKKKIREMKEDRIFQETFSVARTKAILNNKDEEFQKFEEEVRKEKKASKRLEMLMRFIDDHLQN